MCQLLVISLICSTCRVFIIDSILLIRELLLEVILHAHERPLFHDGALQVLVFYLLFGNVLLVFRFDLRCLVHPFLSSSLQEILLVLYHVILKPDTPLLLREIDLANNFVRQEGEVHQDQHEVRLLPPVALALICQFFSVIAVFILGKSFLVTVLNQLFSLLDMWTNVIEGLGVCGIGHYDVPCCALNSLPRHFCVIKLFDRIRIILLKFKSLFHVLVLNNDFISLAQSYRFEKLGQVLIDLYVLHTHSKAKSIHQLGTEDSETKQDEMHKGKNGERQCMVGCL